MLVTNLTLLLFRCSIVIGACQGVAGVEEGPRFLYNPSRPSPKQIDPPQKNFFPTICGLIFIGKHGCI